MTEKWKKMTVSTNAIVDWISVTVKSGKLAVSDWTNDYKVMPKGLLGYNSQVMYEDGRIELSHTERPDMGHHLIYSGDCLRKMEVMYAMSAVNIVKFHAAQNHKFTRIDIAVDVKDGFTAKEAIERYENSECVSKLRRADKVQSITGKGDTLYIGRRGGDRMVRLYDKAAQTNTDGLWTRCEGEFRSFGAKAVVDHMNKSENPEKAIHAIIKGIVDYPQWVEYQNAMGGDMIDMKMERKVTSQTEKWLLEKVAPSLAKFADEHDGFLERFRMHVDDLINERRLTS